MTARNKVLLIGWDAADWKVIHPLLDAGRMPNLQRLVEEGCMGQIATLHPPLSPMLWTSIATGKRPFQHGIHGFVEPTADGLGIQPVTNLSRTCKAVWNIFNQNDLRSIVVGWWPSHPAEPLNGVMVSDHYHRAHGPLAEGWPLLHGCVHPPQLHEPLAELRFHPDELTEEMIAPFIPRYREIDQDKDQRLGGCARTLAECVSIHSAATWLLDSQPWDFFAVYYDAIDHFCHAFMRYHPPRQEQITERDFELYHQVVTQAYLFHDLMLGTLLRKAGPETTVILLSDHGFHPDHLRPRVIPHFPAGPAIEHRDFGILVLSGPGIKQDELLHGASVLDITPTLLTLYGLPVGADMDGKVLVGAFSEPPRIETIPSWEEVPGNDGRHPPHTRLDPVAAREALEQLVALGYIAPPGEDRSQAVADIVAELRYNLGEAYQDADRHAEALEIFRELHRQYPDEQRHAVQRFISAQALGLLDEMRAAVADLDGRRRTLFEQARTRLEEMTELCRKRQEEQKLLRELGESAEGPLLSRQEQEEWARCQELARFQPPLIDYLKACVALMENAPAEALVLLQRVQEAHLARPGLYLQTAQLLLRLQRWDEADATYDRALALDPDNAHAHVGKARIALWRRDFEAAADAALQALQRIYNYPRAHFLLGVALTALGDHSRAAVAFRAALAINPNFPQTHLRLSWLLRRHLGDPAAADEHLRRFSQLRRAAPLSARGPATPARALPAGPPRHESMALAVTPLPPLKDEVVVVSGLPRAGTSMVMQMLTAGGLAALCDGLRGADDDNPDGYFEYEPVKYLHQQAGWLAQARGRAVKIVATLLPYLPPIPCRVVFIERSLEEVLASQEAMLARRGEQPAETPERRTRLLEQYGRQVRQAHAQLRQRPQTHLLVLQHAETLRDPHATAAALNLFLGGQLAVAAMAAAVKPSLHRQRAAGLTAVPSEGGEDPSAGR